MKTTHIIRILGAAAVAAAVIFLTLGDTRADVIKLKDGTTLEGKITFEAADMLKIKIQKSPTISETKTVLMSNVAEVVKSAPDDVDFARLKTQLPTRSLLATSDYRSLIEKGTQAFLNSYPDSKHRPEVEKIKKELEDELAKVDKGFIKLEGEWISPKSQLDFRELIDARILNLQMRQKASGGNFIGALRDFERLEEVYYGTPSFVESVRYSLQLLPSVGQRLKRMQGDVEFVNKQFEENLMKMPESKRQQVIDARAQEVAALKKRFEADKSAGIKWYALNQRDKDDLKDYIQLVFGEIERLKAIDVAALDEQSKQLVKVDELLAEGKLAEAKELLKQTTGGSSKGRTSSSGKYSSGYGNFGKGGSRSGSRKSSSKAKTSYILVLQEKINLKEKAIATAKVQAADSAAGAAATQAIIGEDVIAAAAPASAVAGSEGADPSGGGTGALTELIASTPATSKKEDPKTSGKFKPKKPASKKKTQDRDDRDEADDPERKVASGGFKWSFQKIIIGVAVLLGITVALMKILGIGSAKN